MKNERHDKHSPKKDGHYLLCVPKGWDTYISQEFHEIHLGLERLGWKKLVIDDTPDDTILDAWHDARIVLLWEAYELLERHADLLCNRSDSNGTRFVFFCDDVHYFTPHRREQRMRAFDWADLILATYPDKLVEWFPETRQGKIAWSPHAAASYFFQSNSHPLAARESNSILLSGSRSWPYPFRQFCNLKIPGSICTVIDHPGYPGYPGDRANSSHADTEALMRVGRERYAELLHAHPATLVCGSVFNYLVAKVFESMAAGCIALCERASLGRRLSELGFIEGEHFVGTSLQTVIDDCSNLHKACMRSDPRLEQMASNASLKVAHGHSTMVRAKQIHQMCIDGGMA